MVKLKNKKVHYITKSTNLHRYFLSWC